MNKKVIITTLAILIFASTFNVAYATTLTTSAQNTRQQVTTTTAPVQQQVTTTTAPAQIQQNNQTVNEQTEQVVKQDTTGKLIELKEKELKSINDYNTKYGKEYGLTAYLLNKIRIFSIPFAFLGIAIAAIFQYVIGVRKLDVRDRGFSIMIAIITVFVICQVLPLIFAIVVRGFGG